MSDALIECRQLSKTYTRGPETIQVLQQLDLQIPKGDFVALMGPSGSGKTTLLNLIGGMDRPSSGQVLFQDRDLGRYSDRELTDYRRAEVGFVFEFYNLVPMLTALENVQVGTEISDAPMDPLEALKLVDLADRADHFPGQLSGGQQQRVALARALASNPRLLLCDEPTGALDLATSRQMLGLLRHLNREMGKTVVLITHNGAIAQMADRIAYIRDGGLHDLQVNEKPLAVAEVTW